MSNVIKFQAPFERLKNYDLSPEVRLMKAIVTQAIIDASNIGDDLSSKKIELQAKTWIFGESEDFENTCLHADVEPSFVRRITRNVIKLHKKQVRLKRKTIDDTKQYIIPKTTNVVI